jgi:hypothetical protein
MENMGIEKDSILCEKGQYFESSIAVFRLAVFRSRPHENSPPYVENCPLR